jgi:hypothetical protein
VTRAIAIIIACGAGAGALLGIAFIEALKAVGVRQ